MADADAIRQLRETELASEIREWTRTTPEVFLEPDGLVPTDATVEQFAQIIDAHAKALAEAECQRMRAALQSIANNSCCTAEYLQNADACERVMAEMDAALAFVPSPPRSRRRRSSPR